MRKKVLIVSDYFYPHWTGIAKSQVYLVNLLKNVFDFSVLTVQHEKHLKKEEIIGHIKIYREPYLFSLSRAKYSLHLIFKFFSLQKKTDIIVINSPFTNILFISFLAKLCGKRLVVIHHGDLILPKGISNRIFEKIFDVSSLISFFLADKVSTFTLDYAQNSRVLKHFLHKFSAILIPPAYDWLHFYSNPPRQKKVSTLTKLKKKYSTLFGISGRFVEEKAFDTLFRIVNDVTKKIPDSHFVFAGKTEVDYEDFFYQNQKLLDSIKKNITIAGFLNQSEMAKFYNVIDFIVIPSRSDCFPLVQVEAVLNKKPSVVANIPGARTIVKETGFGLIFESENFNDLEKKLIEAANNKERFEPAYKKVLQMFNLKSNAKNLRKYIEG